MTIDFSNLQEKETALTEALAALDSVVIAYSGGVDSSLLAYYARKVLAKRAVIVIAVSPSLAEIELQAACKQARLFSWDLEEVATDEVEKAEYQINDGKRCYFCKQTLFAALSKMAQARGIKHIAYGANVDDLKDFRPGHAAAKEYQVLSPLQASNLSKEEIRKLAYAAGLPSWDRPQAACLSSRFPTYEKVTVEKLSQVEQAELFLHQLGFRQLRVRHHGDLARIELEQSENHKLASDTDLMNKITCRLKEIGYRYVCLDLDGYVQGSANRLKVFVEGASHG